VAVGTFVGVGVLVGVSDGTAVGVLVGALVVVGIDVDVVAGLGVAVMIEVGVAVGAILTELLLPAETTIINCGAFPPVRLDKLVCVVLVVAITKLYCWLGLVTKDVTSICVHVLAVIGPELPRALPKPGALEKLMVVAPQPPVV